LQGSEPGGAGREEWRVLIPAAILVLGMLAGQPGVSAPEAKAGEMATGLLLVDDTAEPRVTVRWTARGQTVERTQARAYGAPEDATPVEGTNLRAGVSLGGTRLEVGAGHYRGALLRVEIRKIETGRALFSGVDPGSIVRLEVRGVRFNQAVAVRPGSAIVHLRYSLGDIEACSLPADAASQFLLSDPADTLGGVAEDGVNARADALGGGAGRGRAEAVVEDDGTVRLTVDIPYGLLRHLRDPWASELPGTFFEPVRLHAEVEVLPAGVDASPEPAPD
jgi:hypothetical protein